MAVDRSSLLQFFSKLIELCGKRAGNHMTPVSIGIM
jgi:hypothetical protein